MIALLPVNDEFGASSLFMTGSIIALSFVWYIGSQQTQGDLMVNLLRISAFSVPSNIRSKIGNMDN